MGLGGSSSRRRGVVVARRLGPDCDRHRGGARHRGRDRLRDRRGRTGALGARVASLIRDRIVEICDCEGKVVAKGDVLARLDDREVRAQLQELRAREEFAKRELDRQTELIGRGATTTQAYERVSMDLRAIQGLVSVQLEKLAVRAITAPIDGVVLRRDGEVGEIAEAGQILFRIGVLKPLQSPR